MPLGTIAADTIQSGTALTPPVIRDSSGIEIGQTCRAWVNFNGTSGASPVIRAAFNVSSVTRNAVGDYTVNFSNAMPDVNYAVNVGVRLAANAIAGVPGYDVTNTTTAVKVLAYQTSTGASADPTFVAVSVFR